MTVRIQALAGSLTMFPPPLSFLAVQIFKEKYIEAAAQKGAPKNVICDLGCFSSCSCLWRRRAADVREMRGERTNTESLKMMENVHERLV